MASAGTWAATWTDPRLPSPLCQDELWRTTGAAFHQGHPHRGLSGDSPSVAGSNLFMHAWWNSPLTQAMAQTVGIGLHAGVVRFLFECTMNAHYRHRYDRIIFMLYDKAEWPWGLYSSKNWDPNRCSTWTKLVFWDRTSYINYYTSCQSETWPALASHPISMSTS